MEHFLVRGCIVDIIRKKIFPGSIEINAGKIVKIEQLTLEDLRGNEKITFILPGFIDAHVHIESSLIVPSEFARLAVVHGTVATVSDPHEIANVLGIEGVRYMIQNAKSAPFKFYFGASPCVPATSFETAGATLSVDDIQKLFEENHLKYLSEMMNYPGVIHHDPTVMAKIALAKKLNRPIDGHAPGLRGEDLKKYIGAGISTDHETIALDEALEKIKYGMMIAIREGTAAKNFTALHPLLRSHPDKVMFCSDDKHSNDLVRGHINDLVARSLFLGYDFWDVLRAASYNPVKHYKLDVGLLQVGDSADFILTQNLVNGRPLATFIKGIKVAENGKPLFQSPSIKSINHFKTEPKREEEFRVQAKGKTMRVIVALEGELITKEEKVPVLTDSSGYAVTDVSHDILKLAVINRYQNVPPQVAFIKNFGFQKGAIASTVAHDSHNIIAVGVDDHSIKEAVNSLIQCKGGLSAYVDGELQVLPLPVAGLMSDKEGYEVAKQYEELLQFVREKIKPKIVSPFMTLSFMALLVIPELKLSDKGLFDGKSFAFTSLFI